MNWVNVEKLKYPKQIIQFQQSHNFVPYMNTIKTSVLVLIVLYIYIRVLCTKYTEQKYNQIISDLQFSKTHFFVPQTCGWAINLVGKHPNASLSLDRTMTHTMKHETVYILYKNHMTINDYYWNFTANWIKTHWRS